MEQDSYPPSSPGWASSGTVDPPARVPAARNPWTEDDMPHGEQGVRLRRLLWIFTLLTIVLVAPSVIYRIQYAITSANERARLEVARENLKDFKLEQISAAYRMLAQSITP